MIPTATKTIQDERELRVGWASWDKGKYTDRSIKFIYRTNGKIPRTAPELPIRILLPMLKFALEQGELDASERRELKKIVDKLA